MEHRHPCYQPGPHKTNHTSPCPFLRKRTKQGKNIHNQTDGCHVILWFCKGVGTSHGVTLSKNFLLAIAKHEMLPYCPLPAIDNYVAMLFLLSPENRSLTFKPILGDFGSNLSCQGTCGFTLWVDKLIPPGELLPPPGSHEVDPLDTSEWSVDVVCRKSSKYHVYNHVYNSI